MSPEAMRVEGRVGFKAGCGQGAQQHLGTCLINSKAGVLWCSQAKGRWVNSNQKEQGFGKLYGSLTSGAHKGKALQGGGDLVTRQMGDSFQELSSMCDSVAVV